MQTKTASFQDEIFVTLKINTHINIYRKYNAATTKLYHNIAWTVALQSHTPLYIHMRNRNIVTSPTISTYDRDNDKFMSRCHVYIVESPCQTNVIPWKCSVVSSYWACRFRRCAFTSLIYFAFATTFPCLAEVKCHSSLESHIALWLTQKGEQCSMFNAHATKNCNRTQIWNGKRDTLILCRVCCNETKMFA